MTDGPVRPLTPQQLKVADGIRRGLNYKDIGVELGISKFTVRAHVAAIGVVLDEPKELPPRWRIYMWTQTQAFRFEWERRPKAETVV